MIDDIETYKKYFVTLSKKEKREFILDVLQKVQKKSPTFDQLFITLKKNFALPVFFLDDIFDKLLKVISHLSQKQKDKSLQALEAIHKKIQKISEEEKKDAEKENTESILNQLSK